MTAPERYRVYAMLNFVGLPLTRALGYMPGKAGLGMDLPKDAFLQWVGWVMSPRYLFDDAELEALQNFPKYQGALRALCMSDDPWATRPAVELLCSGFTSIKPDIITVTPADTGASRIGHMGFFRPEHRDAVAWRSGMDRGGRLSPSDSVFEWCAVPLGGTATNRGFPDRPRRIKIRQWLILHQNIFAPARQFGSTVGLLQCARGDSADSRIVRPEPSGSHASERYRAGKRSGSRADRAAIIAAMNDPLAVRCLPGNDADMMRPDHHDADSGAAGIHAFARPGACKRQTAVRFAKIFA